MARPPAPPPPFSSTASSRAPRVGLPRTTPAGTLGAAGVLGAAGQGLADGLGAGGQGPEVGEAMGAASQGIGVTGHGGQQGLADGVGFEANPSIGDAFLASQSSAAAAQPRRRASSTNKRARDDEGDHIDWNDQHTALVCKLFAEQVRKGNRPNTHLNNVGYTEVNERFFQCTGIMLKKIQLKNKWDKLKNDLTVWRKLMRKQTGTGWNWDKGTINMDAEWWKKIKAEIPGVGKFKNRPLQNEDDMKVMFGSIINEEVDHWNPMSSNPIIPPSGDAPHHIDLENGEQDDMGANNDLDNEAEILETPPPPTSAKRKAHIILDKPNKKNKSSTALVIQENISKISESAKAFVSSRQAGITIDEVMGHVIACGADFGSDEHFVATELFVKKEQREMFMTMPTKEARFNWLKRKFDMMFGK